ncbi:MAG: pilus (MSHA type) biogenesis protein MshL [Gammaproteobacteria bacterium]|nr:pilus (MSHA type) biogenesis protein MshL [Gammaproteobacteria bacterium]
MRFTAPTIVTVCLALAGCAQLMSPPPEPSSSHLRADAAAPADTIPPVVEQVPFVPVPEPAPQTETFTVVVNDVPVRELLFALARDAKLNVDVHPNIAGNVTLNAVDQTLTQILDRLARQVDLRYEVNQGTLVIGPDLPYYRAYKIDFVNMSRDTKKTVSVATQIQTGGQAGVSTGGGSSGGGAGNNNSTTSIESISNNRFWETLYYNVMAILGHEAQGGGGGEARLPSSTYVIPNAESGVLTVFATHRQHAEVQAFVDKVMASAQRQVLIEATIVEVILNDRYRAGIDWSRLASSAGFTLQQALLPGTELGGSQQFFLLNYADRQTDGGALDVSVKALSEFGDTQVLSSPKLMVLNNQTALLKVVNNEVYFTIDVETTSTQGVVNTTFDTTPHTVPVGFVMSVTPGIYENDSVMLNVRPTISRIDRFVNDPNPELARAEVTSPIPVIQTREIESLLKVVSGQIAVLGGLMQDDFQVSTQGIPFLAKVPGLGELFKNRDNDFTKSELVVFLKPTVIRNASLDADLRNFRELLNPTVELDLAK